tara:strand:+ start:181 stop:339 length:159 start_codon:yes stop_codon:yes gene_type:complete
MQGRTQYFWQPLEMVQPIIQGKPIQCDVFSELKAEHNLIPNDPIANPTYTRP